MGYSPWGHRESDTTERLHFHFVTPWTVVYQDPLSMGFSRQEYWSGLPFSPPQGLLNPRTELMSPMAPALQVDSLPLSHLGSLMIPNQVLKISTLSTLVRWPLFFASAFKKLSCNYSFIYAVMRWA